jgi:hypothetical protein
MLFGKEEKKKKREREREKEKPPPSLRLLPIAILGYGRPERARAIMST